VTLPALRSGNGSVAVPIVAGPTFAHYGTAAYEMKDVVTVKGTVTDFEFVNPHCQIYFDVKNEKGESEQWPVVDRVPVGNLLLAHHQDCKRTRHDGTEGNASRYWWRRVRRNRPVLERHG
jgi:hypothetical protein